MLTKERNDTIYVAWILDVHTTMMMLHRRTSLPSPCVSSRSLLTQSLTLDIGKAHAARSGGRAGGSRFGAARSSWGSSSFGGGGSLYGSGFGGGSSLHRSSLSSSVPGASGSSSSNYMSSTSSTSAVPIVHRSTHLHVGPRPFLSSFFLFPGFGYGYGYGGGSLFSTIFTMAIVAYLAFNIMNIFGGPETNRGGSRGGGGFFDGGDKVSVAKIQVGLLATAASIKKDIEKQANRTDTSDPESLHFFLQEVVLSLLRNQPKCIYGYSEGKIVTGLDRGEEAFNLMSLEERRKIEQETFVNYSGRSKKRDFEGPNNTDPNELIMVTILLAAEGVIKPPKVVDRETLNQTLTQLGGVSTSQLLACEVLWTPQAEGDTYSQEDLITDFPYMNTL